MPDFTIRQGDIKPVLNDTLTYSDTTAVDLTGSTVNFVMRALTASDVTTNRAATVGSPSTAGKVSYTFTTDDTKNAGLFEGYWKVTGGQADGMTFPTVGSLEIEIVENLTTPGGARLLSLTEAKGYLNIGATDRTHDTELLRFIDALAPVVENITGPILQRTYSETYDGGTTTIELRHRPVVQVTQVVEYRAAVAYNLTQVPTPDVGTIYSYIVEPQLGRITRRTVAGGIVPFPGGPEAVYVTYIAGFAQVPANVRMAALELLRVNYQQTQEAGRARIGQSGFGGIDEDLSAQPALGFFVPTRVRELLMPNKRFPSFA